MEQEHAETYAQFKFVREDSQQLWKIKFHVDSARKNFEQAQQRTSHLYLEIQFQWYKSELLPPLAHKEE